jgi:hypothetical protein
MELSPSNYKDTPYDGLPSSRGTSPLGSGCDDEPDTDIDQVVYSVASDSPDDDDDNVGSDTAPERPAEGAEAELSTRTSYNTQCYSP